MAPAAAALSKSLQQHGSELPHVAIFPLMAKGHTIPLLDLACLLRRRGLAAVTLFTTPGSNTAFIRAALSRGGGDAAVVELPFPDGAAAAGAGSVEGVASRGGGVPPSRGSWRPRRCCGRGSRRRSSPCARRRASSSPTRSFTGRTRRR
ncbi:unnamed protein product [Urochloa humidicola]